uniref:Uncharacterized protein n=1 Tax=Schistosoma haematobium TaxID=6185 RepID=A0A095BYS6_SCHHA
MIQQFQQQNLLYQSALLNTLTKENASKLRIFGYIHLFAVIIKQSMIQLPFRLSSRQSFTLMLRYSVDYLADNLKDSEKPLFAMNNNSTIYMMLKKDQVYPKNYFITIEKTQINLTETGMIRTITLYETKILIFGLVFLRALIAKLFLGMELGLSTTVMTSNKTSINNKLLGSICTYIYRKIMVDIISERTRTTDLPIPGELQNMIFNDTEMKQIYGMIGRRYLANFIAKCKRWLQDYGRRILTL